MTHYTDQFNSTIPELAIVNSLEQERFIKERLKTSIEAHQLEFCWQPVPCSVEEAGSNRKRPLVEFQTVLGMT